MTASFSTDGIRPEQGPSLALPMMFFLCAPVALAGVGLVLVMGGAAAVSSRYHPFAQVATHLGTLGYLGTVMIGALYQMIPVLAGVPVPAPRLARGVLGFLVLGIVALVIAFLGGSAIAFRGAALALGVAITVFVGQSGSALARAPTRSRSVSAMRLAVLGLSITLVLAIFLAIIRSGVWVTGPFVELFVCHVSIGCLMWIGGLIAGVSWQVLPMFYVSPKQPKVTERMVLIAGLISAGAPALAYAGGVRGTDLAWCFLPSAIAVLLVQPIAWHWQIRRRGRKRKDASLLFWHAAAVLGPLAGVMMLVAWRSHDPRGGVLFAWIFLFGWAGLIVHGMLTRIVPFLVWFHRFAARAGLAPIPSMRQLWPDARVRIGFVMHMSAVILGTIALASGNDLVARVAGANVLLLALGLMRGIVGALATRD